MARVSDPVASPPPRADRPAPGAAAAANGAAPIDGRGPSAPRLRDRIDRWRAAPVAVALVLAGVYLVLAPRSPDLAAHIFRAELFGREGFTIWNGQWYGGHHTPAYSVLSPPLGWLLGPQLMGAIAAVAAAALGGELLRGHWGPAATRWAAVWLGAGTATMLFTNRLPFVLGTAFAFGAALALQRRRPVVAPALAVLAALSSPVVGLYLFMAGLAYALGVRGEGLARRRRAGIVVGAAALAVPAALNVAFPEGGYGPFEFLTYVAIPIACAFAAVLLGPEERVLRAGTALYAAGATVAWLFPTPMGNNAMRLGAFVAGPLLLAAVTARRPGWAQGHGTRRSLATGLIAVMLVALGAWQWSGAVRDLYKASTDPVADPEYFSPVREWLALRDDQARVEIPFTFGHWEGAEVASEAPLARGWLRQLDTGLNPIFYGDGLNEVTYASWLSENAVRYVALPDAKPDTSAYRERALIESGLPYLKLRATFEHWRIYEVTLPAPVVISQGDANITLEQFRSDELLLDVRRPGSALLRVRWTPYWLAKGACVERDGAWTRVTASRSGFLRLVTRFSPERIVQRGQRCDGV